MTGPVVDERFSGPWPAVGGLLATELERYLVDAAKPNIGAATTGCELWTGDQLTAHLVATFQRFTTMLERSRRGDFQPPFDRSELSAENLRAVAAFDGDPVAELRPAVEQFCALATDPDELMAHQFGPIPVALQATFGLAELAIHHDDLLTSVKKGYRPDDELVAARIAPAYEAVMDVTGLVDAEDRWRALLTVTGRRPPEDFFDAAAAMTDPLEWEKVRSRYGDNLILFETRFDEMRHPTTGRLFERLVLESVDWVNCVAIDGDGRHVMVRQFRFGAGETTLETPGGMVDDGEDSETAIRRELQEETGYGGGRWRYLGAVQPNPAVHDHLCHHWLATEVEPVGETNQGPGEHIAVELLSADEVMGAARNGEIRHALALSAIARVLDIWEVLRLDQP